jgi:hypothetical protein
MARYDLTRPIRNASEWDAFNALYDGDTMVTLYVTLYDTLYDYKTERIKEYDIDDGDTIIHLYWFLDKNNVRVFYIGINSKGMAYSDINVVNKDVLCIRPPPPLKPLTTLETFYYIRTLFCFMLGIKPITITDVAKSVCKDDTNRKHVYNLIAYRIFATSLPLESISIYSYFYNNKRTPVFDQSDSDNLNYFRTMTVETLRTKLRLYLNKNAVKQDLLTLYTHLLIRMHRIPNATTVYAFFNDFFNSELCQDFAKMLSSVHTFLCTDARYKSFYNNISQYHVDNTDSVYMKITDTPVSRYKGNNSRRRRIKRLRQSRHLVRSSSY